MDRLKDVSFSNTDLVIELLKDEGVSFTFSISLIHFKFLGRFVYLSFCPDLQSLAKRCVESFIRIMLRSFML